MDILVHNLFLFMQFQILLSLFVGLAMAAPVAQNPFFQVKITQGHAGGSQTGYGATISKQKVNLIESSLHGDVVTEEDFVDHQPPFLRLPEVKPYAPLALPAKPTYSNLPRA